MSDILDISQVMKDAGGYSPEAARFIRDGLQHTVCNVHGERVGDPETEEDLEDESFHVSGQQLCLGLRDFALQQYGLLAKMVLNRWGLRQTEDFGNIVFALVNAGMLRKTEDDTIEDFVGVFDFDEAFATPVIERRAS